jgi:dihydroorotate dehydrogenase (NAD+) catalytic subunit
MRLDRLGGIVTKAVSREPRAGNRAPRVAEFHGGMLNSVGLANPGLAAVRSQQLPWLADNLRQVQVLVRDVGFTVEE